MAPSLEQFTAHVVTSGLLSAEQLAQVQDRLAPERRPRSAEELGKLLVHQGLLTPFQASCLWRGRSKGLVLGEYVVLDKLGQGGMGMVLKARHRRMDRVVALKTLPPHAMREPEAVQRFFREVKAAARLVHPNIVTAYDAGEQEGIHYLVMEYVEGQDLATLVKQHGPLPVAQALDCLVQAARGLAYAHSQGVIHRDIKPGNLLVDRHGVVKILDMGLARLVLAPARDAQTEEQLTASGQVMGTCDYMAPEQAVSTHQADHRADIYSLGCTLYRLLTGEPPYTGRTLMEMLVAHREAPIPSLRAKRPDVSEELEGVFRRMVAKRPEERYGTMVEVVGALEGCLATCPAVAGAGEEGSLGGGELSISAWLERMSQPAGGDEGRPAGVAEPGVAGGAGWAETLAHGPDHRTPTVVRPPVSREPRRVGEEPKAAQERGRLAELGHGVQLAGARGLVVWAAVGLAAGLLVVVAALAVRSLFLRPVAQRTVPVPGEAAPGAKKPAGKVPKELAPAKPDWKPAFQSADQQAKALASQQEFGKAIALYSPLLEQFRDLDLLGKVKEATAQVEAEASAASSQAQAQARRLSEQKKFAEARQTLQPVIERFGIAEHADLARKLLGEIDQAEKAEQAAQAAKAPPPPLPKPLKTPEEQSARAELARLRQEQAQWRDATAEVDKRIAAWDFRGALAALDQVSANPPGWKERLAARREEILRMGRLKARILAAINQADPPLEKRVLLLKGINGPITGADEQGISAKLPNGKVERHAWGQLSEKSLEKLLLLAADPQNAEDWIAAGLVVLGTGATGLAEGYFERAKGLGADIARYLVPLAEGAVGRVEAALRQAQGELAAARQTAEPSKPASLKARFAKLEKQFQEVAAQLDAFESRYGATPWFASHKEAVAAARQAAGWGLADSTAERLYAEAVELFEQGELFDLKPLVQELKNKYATTPPVTDASRKPSFTELEKAAANLGKRLVVRQDGKGDFTSIQAAIDAAPPNSLIEIGDNGTYAERLGIQEAKDGLTLRGQRGTWPVIASAALQSPAECLVSINAPRTIVEGLVIAHYNAAGRPHAISASRLGVRLRRCIVFSTGTGVVAFQDDVLIDKCVVSSIEGHPLHVRDCIVFAGLGYAQRIVVARNVLAVGTCVGGPGCEFLHCTVPDTVRLDEREAVLRDCIVKAVQARGRLNTIENCNVYGTPAFVDEAQPAKGCFGGDPQFVDPDNLDYRLRPTSPCRSRASDGGDVGFRYTPEIIEVLNVALELRRRGIIKF
jgi:tRNA A-37 threonylcarbamoyl transferase component Bud32